MIFPQEQTHPFSHQQNHCYQTSQMKPVIDYDTTHVATISSLTNCYYLFTTSIIYSKTYFVYLLLSVLCYFTYIFCYLSDLNCLYYLLGLYIKIIYYLLGLYMYPSIYLYIYSYIYLFLCALVQFIFYLRLMWSWLP